MANLENSCETEFVEIESVLFYDIETFIATFVTRSEMLFLESFLHAFDLVTKLI
jgi:hypothetical protein